MGGKEVPGRDESIKAGRCKGKQIVGHRVFARVTEDEDSGPRSQNVSNAMARIGSSREGSETCKQAAQ